MLSSSLACEQCGKLFTTKGSLVTHTRVHSGEKPYVCPDDTCRTSFSQQANLIRHIKSMHRGSRLLLAKAKAEQQRTRAAASAARREVGLAAEEAATGTEESRLPL
ncbi:hypothetical protein BASA81_007339 [Batrachochytrium salamandrivorans]|nr:hypothetical protein BASA81_007339 [Batrachochytrium salamandrivorans]